MPNFYIWYTPSEGDSKNDHEISGVYTCFCVVMKQDLAKGDYNLKVSVK